MANGNRLNRVRQFMDTLKKGFDESPENTRGIIWETRRKQGLSDPTRAAQVGSNSQAAVAYRELASAYGLPGGFTNRMLMERAQAGVGIGDLDMRPGHENQRLQDIFTVKASELEGQPRDMNDSRSASQIIKEAEDQLELEVNDYKAGLRAMPLDQKVAGALGRLANDANEDRSRSSWWLINAAQATSGLINEVVAAGVNPNLLTHRNIANERLRRAEQKGLLKRVGNTPLKNYNTGQAVGYDELDPLPGSGAQSSRRLSDINTNYDDPGPEILNNPANYTAAHPSIKQRDFMGEDGSAGRSFEQRRLNPNMQTLAGLGAGSLAINQGIGLFGRHDGYTMSVPDEIDPRNTDNAVFEVGSRYLLSRTGDLMDKDSFKLERIDVSDSEYNQYKGYLRDKELDLNPLDGDFNIGGLVKGTTEGIRGPEVNLFYKSLPLHDTLMPVAGALGGVMVGGLLPNVRQLRLKGQRRSLRNKPIAKGPVNSALDRAYRAMPEVRRREFDGSDELHNPFIKPGGMADKATKKLENFFMDAENELTGMPDINVARQASSMLIGGGLGLAGAATVGNNIEDERRRRKFNDRLPGVSYDKYKENASNLLDKKYANLKENPPTEESGKWQPSRTAQQQALMTQALDQQAIVNEITDPIVKQRAQRELDKSFEALTQIDVLEGQKGQPYNR